jgi:hypothetical protein
MLPYHFIANELLLVVVVVVVVVVPWRMILMVATSSFKAPINTN